MRVARRRCGIPRSSGRRSSTPFWKLDPRVQFRNPVMFSSRPAALLTTVIFVQELIAGTGDPRFTGQLAGWLWFTVLFANLAEAMAEGRGKAQAATLRRARAETTARRLARRRRGVSPRGAARRRPRPRRRRRADPRRRRDRRGRRQRRRIGDHRRIGAGDPRGRRRSLGGHGRHARPVRLDHGARHLEPGRDLPRPDDRARRRRAAAEDAERDRAEHPARGADADLPARRRDAAAVRALRRAPTSRSRCSSRCSSA